MSRRNDVDAPCLKETWGSSSKRAIERLLVQPLSNLMATGQIHSCDHIRITHADGSASLTFFRQADEWEVWKADTTAA